MSATKRTAPPTTQAAFAASKRPRNETDEPGVHVIFVAISHHKDIGKEGHDCRIPCDPALGSFEAGDVLGTLTPQRLQELELDLGPGLVSNIGPKETQTNGLVDLSGRIARSQKFKPKVIQPVWNDRVILLHQQVVTMLWAERTQRVTVEYCTLDFIMRLIKEGGNSLADQFCDHNRPIIFHIPLDSKDWSLHPEVRSLYEAIDALQHLFNNISVYPAYHESWNYGFKIADIKALDSIATKDSTPEPYRHRPKTCLGIGLCRLDETQGPQFVRFALSDRTDYMHHVTTPSYNTSIHDQPFKQESGPIKRVIHQQCFSSVSEWGYIRVFMVGNRIIARSFTSSDQRTNVHSTSTLRSDCHFDFRADGFRLPDPDPEVTKRQEAKLEELDNFCKWWQHQLTTHDPELFESLNVGCILRIGLTEANLDGKFFILSVHRWFASPFFSMDLTAKPFDQFCKAFGEQFARVYGSFAATDVPDN
ncbi:hypothetical protein FDENT_2595 [Fusarium denticulatum]|uniref:Uncharacterized protein n=1 Tax=Fusarium denticulatum TaxID=48507 RepID=A0A8H5XFE3_9HYPO|nr:hypothetical protein FDENT_2595 [Fusarium denticulatum]